MTLASTLYAAFRSAQSDPTALPAWGNLPSDERAAWERVAEVARVEIVNAEMRARFDRALDAERERRGGIRVVEQAKDERPIARQLVGIASAELAEKIAAVDRANASRPSLLTNVEAPTSVCADCGGTIVVNACGCP